MAFVVEDGTGLEAANSYAAVSALDSYASERGIELPATEGSKQRLLILATEYADSLYAGRWSGQKSKARQSLQWPRYGASLSGHALDWSAIPRGIAQAICQLASDIHAGGSVNAVSDGTRIIREKVDVLEIQYADNGGNIARPAFPKFEAMIAPYLTSGGAFRVYRA